MRFPTLIALSALTGLLAAVPMVSRSALAEGIANRPDVLGVEQAPNGLSPVRFECKAISSGSGRVRVYLSRNELAVARNVRRAGPGRWVLVGVQPNGASVDLTPLLDDLLDEEEKPLEPLYERGLEPDGFRLIVERRGHAGESRK